MLAKLWKSILNIRKSRYFNNTAHGIYPICAEEIQGRIRGKQSVPLAMLSHPAEEQFHTHAVKRNYHLTIIAVQTPAILYALLYTP